MSSKVIGLPVVVEVVQHLRVDGVGIEGVDHLIVMGELDISMALQNSQLSDSVESRKLSTEIVVGLTYIDGTYRCLDDKNLY